MDQLQSHDMYGHEIHLLGETGYGVSVAFGSREDGTWKRPYFTFFHVSDGFQQSLFSVWLEVGDAHPRIVNLFHERLWELMELRPHG